MSALAWDSLRWRLPLFIAAVIVAVVGTFLALAYREVETALNQTARARAQGAADQIAGLLAQSTQQRAAELQRAASHPSVREFLEHPSDASEQAVRAHLGTLTSPNPQIIELWDGAGRKVLTAASPKGIETLPAGTEPPTAPHISRFLIHRDALISEVVTAVEPKPSVAGARSPGFLIVRRPAAFTGSSADTLNRLVGNSAVIKVGNQVGEGWTDMTRLVPPPPVALARSAPAAYRGADGERRQGALTKIAGTPWAVWVEFSESAVLAPARSSLTRMIVIALVVVLIAGVVVWLMTGAITTPLSQLTNASEAMAGGEYSRRVKIERRDEIGRLGAAFNAMAERVERAHHELEERVRQRVEELKDSRAEVDHFFALTPDMLCIADMTGRFKRVNAAWRDTLGWTDEELTAVPYVEFVHPDDRPATQEESSSLAAGDPTLTFENRYRCKDGSYKWLSWRAAPMTSRGLIYAAARDVTEQKRTARELEQRAAELVAVNRELEAFSYSVSHDLRAPLRHIGGFATLLAESTSLNADGARLLQTIIDAATRMGCLIDDLLAFSRVGRSHLERSDVSLGQLVGEVRQEIMTGINGRRVAWHVHPLPTVKADRALLRLALVNLLSNAVKYSAPRDTAEIEVGTLPAAGGETVLFVRDNGVGFDMQYGHKLFGVFQRLHGAEEFEGTGIGLANVKRIVHRHGGRVWAESVVDQGATFFVALPAERLS